MIRLLLPRRLMMGAAGALCALAPLCALVPALAAQPEVTWEPVGDRPHDTYTPYSVGPDGDFWAAYSEGYLFEGLFRLPTPFDSTTAWEKVSPPPRSGPLLTYFVGRDTILVDEYGSLYRSTDRGSTWVRGPSVKPMRLFEIPRGLPHGGRLVAVRYFRMASYSDDRGATWTAALGYDGPDDDAPTIADSAAAERIAVVTTGPHAGRLVAGGLSGVTVSDDGGRIWRATDEWAYYQMSADCIATLHGQAPGGGDRLVAVINDIRIYDDSIRVSISDDGGETWRRGQGLLPGSFRTCAEVVDLGGGRAAAVMYRGPVYWSEDGGETWVRWAEWTSLGPADGYANWAIAGPDGRLYVGVTLNGGERVAFDRRTSEPVASWAVASEPGTPAPPADGLGLRVFPNPTGGVATVALRLAAPERVRVSVIDVQGREVVAVYDGPAADGQRVAIETAGLPAGSYLVRMTATAASGASATAALTVAR